MALTHDFYSVNTIRAPRTEAASQQAHASNHGGQEPVQTSSFYLSSEQPRGEHKLRTDGYSRTFLNLLRSTRRGKHSLLGNSESMQAVPGEPQARARVPTCGGPRQPAIRGAALSPPSARSEIARGSRTAAAAETKQERSKSLLRLISLSLLVSKPPLQKTVRSPRQE